MIRTRKAKPGGDATLQRRQSSSDTATVSLFSSSNRPSLFVGIVIGMAVMRILTRSNQAVDPENTLLATTTESQSNTNTATATAVRNGSTKRQHPKFDPSWDIFQRIEAEQTGRVRGPSHPLSETVERRIALIGYEQLSERDGFSASWMQTQENFLSMDLDGIGICEDAAFFAYSDRRHRGKQWRMTMDWLDFSVEHMSKWYGMMAVYVNDIPFHSVIEKLDDYLKRGSEYPVEEEPVFKQAIAIIAFMPFEDSDHLEKAKDLTVRNLAATLESLRRAGFGRAVVVGMKDNDLHFVEEAFALVRQQIRDSFVAQPGDVEKLGHMEVGFAQGHSGHAETPHQQINVPRAALMGLRDVFQVARDDGTSGHTKTWLGDHYADYWKIVFLTEPDQILATRPSTLKALKESVEGGAVLVPWRLQLIPHEADVRGARETWRYLRNEGEFADVMELDALDVNADKCCDEYKGPNHKPGLPPHFPACENFWYRCGFMKDKEGDPHAHDRLKPYKLIKLKHGTQMVSLAGHEHGRRCLPQHSTNADICDVPLN